ITPPPPRLTIIIPPQTNNYNAPRANQRIHSSNRQPKESQFINLDDPYYDPEDDDFLESDPFYYVSKEYAQYCIDNDDHSRLSRRDRRDALNILDQ
ncbi:13372_t:CDS:2, partial [Racocetra fulgida]